MKVALCFFGMPPMKCNKNERVIKDLSLKLWKKNVIDPNNVDIFIHCWDKNDEEGLKDKYNPKKSIFEDHIVFDKNHPIKYDYEDGGGTTLNMFLSQAYSAKKSIELKRQFEKENGFIYDIVMMSRMDCLWFKSPDLKNLNPKKFYVSNWNQTRSGRDSDKPFGIKSNITTERRNYKKILDYWFISNSKYIDKFSQLYDFIPEWNTLLEKNIQQDIHKCWDLLEKRIFPKKLLKLYKRSGFSNHSLKKDFLEHLGLWDKVEFKYYEHHHHNLQRYFYRWKDYKRHKKLFTKSELNKLQR